MSDDEFWKSTPAKIFALLDYHAQVENPKDLKKKNTDVSKMTKMTPDIFKAWSA